MDLYFLRHAIAAERDEQLYPDDSLRPLTKPGRHKMHRASLGMRAMGLTFDVILSSPYLRAQQTAGIVAQTYKIKKNQIQITDKLLEPALIKDLSLKIKALAPASAKKILLVGHEPHLSALISSLLGSPQPLPIDFKKGGLCSVSVSRLTSSRATLNWLLTPSQLSLMAVDIPDPDL